MTRRRKLVVGVVVALLLAGAATGVALARNQGASAPRLVQGKPLLTAAAAYLGVPLHTLKGEVHPGHPLAAIARATPGRTVAGLTSALVHDASFRLTEGQGHMAIGRVQAHSYSAFLHKHIAAYVAGLCPLHLSKLMISLGGTCNGMSPA